MPKNKEYRQYENLQKAVDAKMIMEQNYFVFKAAKDAPWSSFKDFYLCRGDESCIPKLDRLFALTPDLEIEIYHYIINMQEL